MTGVLVVAIFICVLQALCDCFVKYELIYHSVPESWHDANEICEATNARLIKLNSTEKTNFIMYFKDNQWNNSITTDFWIGLIDTTPPNQSYTWSDDTLLGVRDTFEWETNEPDYLKTAFCIRAEKNAGKFRTARCQLKYPFICEKHIGECTYSVRQDQAVSINKLGSIDYRSPQGNYSNICDCISVCFQYTLSKYWVFSANDEQKLCTCYRPYYPAKLAGGLIPSPNYTTVIMICYKATLFSDLSATGFWQSPSTNFDDAIGQPMTDICPSDHESTSHSLETSSFAPDMTSFTPSTTPWISTGITSQIKSDTTPVKNTQKLSTYPISAQSNVFSSTTMRPTEPQLTQSSSFISSSTPWYRTTQHTSTQESKTVCNCACRETRTEPDQFMERILGALTINRRNMSAWKRKYISCNDDRWIAKGIGYLGSFFMLVVFGGLLLLDLSRLVSDVTGKTKDPVI